jgi:hypothetical protein
MHKTYFQCKKGADMQATMTKHAAVRQQQRGIPPLMIDLLFNFGSSEPAGNGSFLLFFDKPAKRRLDSYAGRLAKVFQEHLDVYVVVANETVITTGHRYDGIRRH